MIFSQNDFIFRFYHKKSVPSSYIRAYTVYKLLIPTFFMETL
jgi:hypothetical protein